nr:hypothetical protein [Tanacetum cinerariifolium]
MERKWMYGMNISDPKYVNGVQSFLIAAESDRVAKGNIEIFCPCSQCKNFVPYDDIKAIEYHLLKYGFVRNYTCWSEHGESLVDNTTLSHVLNANENNESYINDRHGNLNEMLHDLDANDGYSTKGKQACPICEDDTSSRWLDNCKKTVFMGHRRSLPSNHPYRGMSLEFDGRMDLLGLLLNIPGKTKDGINARKDMVSWGIRLELAPVENDKKCTYLPPACYTMSKAEKTQFCKCLHDIKVPSSYSANIRSLVSMKDLIGPEVLDSWQRDIIVTLCELEMYFPPSFFDVMVHLASHIVSEIKACGPIHLHYMFHFERYMGIVKGYVRNQSRPEGSIVEGYASEEVIDFYTNYLEGVKDKVAANMGHPNADRIVERLGEGPRLLVKTYQGYEINGYTFYTKMKDEKSMMQNSGVTMIASTWITKKSYYGVIQEIWELDYYTFKIPLFMCKWVNNSSGVKVDDYGFTLIDLGTDGYTSEPFILTKQTTQLLFVQDPSNPKWHIVMSGKRHILGVDNVVDEEEYDQFDELPPFS